MFFAITKLIRSSNNKGERHQSLWLPDSIYIFRKAFQHTWLIIPTTVFRDHIEMNLSINRNQSLVNIFLKSDPFNIMIFKRYNIAYTSIGTVLYIGLWFIWFPWVYTNWHGPMYNRRMIYTKLELNHQIKKIFF